MTSSIFVIVKVTYDYYRFQDNLGAATDIDDARRLAAEFANKLGVMVIEDKQQSEDMLKSEVHHILIEEFPQAILKPFQKRVVEEKAEVDIKRQRLSAFIGSLEFTSLPIEEQVRLIHQKELMDSYSAVLGERIAAFTPHGK